MVMPTLVQILDKQVLHSACALEKGMHPTILFPVVGK